jgi:hypothetical protein
VAGGTTHCNGNQENNGGCGSAEQGAGPQSDVGVRNRSGIWASGPIPPKTAKDIAGVAAQQCCAESDADPNGTASTLRAFCRVSFNLSMLSRPARLTRHVPKTPTAGRGGWVLRLQRCYSTYSQPHLHRPMMWIDGKVGTLLCGASHAFMDPETPSGE